MKLSVPVVKQPAWSSDCGIACVAMILDYYGVPYEYKKLRKEIGVFRWGTTAPQLGTWLLKHGFEVEIVTMHPTLFTIYSKFKTPKDLLKHFQARRGKIKKRVNLIALDHFINFTKAGGVVTPKVPDIKDIQTEISAKRPLISLLTHWFLHDPKKLGPRFTFHFNVVTGIDKKSIYVNDPDWDYMGGLHKHGIKEYMYAVHASAFGAIDNASLMKIRRKR